MNEEQQELTRYFNEIERYPVLSREEEQALAQRVKNGDKEALDKLVVSNLRFVVQVAHTFSGYCKYKKISMLDLIQEGNKGLVIATKKFDPDRGYKLISYAVWWIRVEMQKLVISNFSLVKVGTTSLQRKLFFKLGRITEILMEDDVDKKAELREDLAEITKVTVEQVKTIETRFSWKDRSIDKECTKLNSGMDLNSPVRLVDILEEKTPWQDTLDHRKNYRHTIDCIYPAIDLLNEREQLIIQQRWLGPEKVTLNKIGQQLGITRERVRQIEKAALIKIKSSLERQGILDSKLG